MKKDAKDFNIDFNTDDLVNNMMNNDAEEQKEQANIKTKSEKTGKSTTRSNLAYTLVFNDDEVYIKLQALAKIEHKSVKDLFNEILEKAVKQAEKKEDYARYMQNYLELFNAFKGGK